MRKLEGSKSVINNERKYGRTLIRGNPGGLPQSVGSQLFQREKKKPTHPATLCEKRYEGWFYVFLRKEPIKERGGKKFGNFFSAKYTIRFELEIYKVGFPFN